MSVPATEPPGAPATEPEGSLLLESTLRLQATALRSAANGVVITDVRGFITWVNPAACAMTGYSADELVGQHTRILKSGEHLPDFYGALWKTITRGDTWSGTIVNRRKNGALYHEEQTIAPVVDEQGEVTHFIAIKQDVTVRHNLQVALVAAHLELARRLEEIEELNRQLREQAIRDPLTNLCNRRFYDESIEREAAQAARSDEPLSIALLDVDGFKQVNDLHGHAAGDQVLRHLAEVLRHRVRSSDLLCRFGGEEFVVVMVGAPASVAADRAETWRAAFAATTLDVDGGPPLRCTMSIGVAEHESGRELIQRTLARADEALYAAKRAGRDRVVTASALPSPQTSSAE